MKSPENIQEFYSRVPPANGCVPGMQNANPGHFNVYARDDFSGNPPHRRRDFYKISFIAGVGRVHFADKWVEASQPVLIFSNPQVAYSWEASGETQKGWFCFFTEPFLHAGDRLGPLNEPPLSATGNVPVYFPNEEQQAEITLIFQKMVREMQSGYAHKFLILRDCLRLLVHEMLKMGPAASSNKQINASFRISSLFLDLLERQFRFDGPSAMPALKSPQDFANSLCIHVNHLNRAVKEATGKTTSEQIAQRIVQEANTMLRHSHLSVSEIGYALGFEYPPLFHQVLP